MFLVWQGVILIRMLPNLTDDHIKKNFLFDQICETNQSAKKGWNCTAISDGVLSMVYCVCCVLAHTLIFI